MLPFIILSHGRSGSTLLTRSLDAHPNITCYAEVFNAIEADRATAATRKYLDGEDPVSFCHEQIYTASREASAIGFKLHVNQMQKSEEQRALWSFLRTNRDINIIFLRRKNLFDSYVSNQRALHSGRWRREPGESVVAGYLEPLSINTAHCESVMRWQRQRIEQAMENFQDHRRFDITYEDLVSDFQNKLNSIFSFLGVREHSIKPSLAKMNIVSHEEGITNYGEVKEYFRESEFSQFFL